MDDDLAVDGALKEGAHVQQALAQQVGVGEVAVVHQCQLPGPERLADGLRVLEPRAPRRGVADVIHVLKSSGRTDAEVMREIGQVTADWLSKTERMS